MYNVIYGTDAGSTGYTYRIDGFDIIGKTGTSQIYNNETNSYSTGDNDYIFSFAGMYPKDNPEVIIYAAMKKPTWGKSSGLYTNIKSLMENIAKYKNMFTEVTEKETTTYTVKSYLNKNVEDVKAELEEQGIKVSIIGDGEKIIKQSIKANTVVAPGERIILLTNSSEYKMPDITGWSRKQVVYLADMLSIAYQIDGYGYVVNQSISSGEVVSKDMTLSVNLENKYDIAGSSVEEETE
jgi:penicillin-binding protein 2B